jgi:hypothetical protein
LWWERRATWRTWSVCEQRCAPLQYFKEEMDLLQNLEVCL